MTLLRRWMGNSIPGGLIHVYDTFGGTTTQVAEVTVNAAGNFYADIVTPLLPGNPQLHCQSEEQRWAGVGDLGSGCLRPRHNESHRLDHGAGGAGRQPDKAVNTTSRSSPWTPRTQVRA